MTFEITFRHLEPSNDLHAYAEDEANELAADFPRVEHVHVILETLKRHKIAEVVVYAKNHIHTEAKESGERMRTSLRDGIGNHPYLRDIRGRGLLFALEYDCPNKNDFGVRIADILKAEDGILLNSKWHRMSFAPPFIITDDEADRITDAVVRAFQKTADGWED